VCYAFGYFIDSAIAAGSHDQIGAALNVPARDMSGIPRLVGRRKCYVMAVFCERLDNSLD
jgi:hypothetical protein